MSPRASSYPDANGSVQNPPSTDGESADVLDDPHCRHLLEYLRTCGGVATTSSVARHVVAGLTDTPPDEVSESVRRRTQTWFHHGFLPKLDDRGVVEFDSETGTVHLGDPSPDRDGDRD